MPKFCVFCGEPPEDKNKEHVLPQRLLKETGDSKRVVKMGFDVKSQKSVQFSRNSLTKPSCAACNDEFSSLECKIKLVVSTLLRRIDVSVVDYIFLMDWMDKVRIGHWLNYHVLKRNPTKIAPRFHIKDRIGREDSQNLGEKTWLAATLRSLKSTEFTCKVGALIVHSLMREGAT